MYEQWLREERFYTVILPSAVAIFLVLLMGYFMVRSHVDARKSTKKFLNYGILGAAVVVIVMGLVGHGRYQHWVEQNKHITPGVRDRQYIFGLEVPYSADAVRNLQESRYLYQHLEALDMYERQPVAKELEAVYLGEINDEHYFARQEGDFYSFRYMGPIEWTDDGSRELVGYAYQLTDPQFEEIGFLNQYDYFLETIRLPKEEQKTYDDSAYNLTERAEKLFGRWIF